MKAGRKQANFAINQNKKKTQAMKLMNRKGRITYLIAIAAMCAGSYAFAAEGNLPIDGRTGATPQKKEMKAKECDKCKEVIREYDIPAQRFDETAQALVHATGCFIHTDLSKTGAIKVNAVKGKMNIRDAIKMAIKGTGLKITHEKAGELTVELEKK